MYWRWQRGIRVSLFVPPDERPLLSAAPEDELAPPGQGETMTAGWVQREEAVRRSLGFSGICHFIASSLVWLVLNGDIFLVGSRGTLKGPISSSGVGPHRRFWFVYTNKKDEIQKALFCDQSNKKTTASVLEPCLCCLCIVLAQFLQELMLQLLSQNQNQPRRLSLDRLPVPEFNNSAGLFLMSTMWSRLIQSASSFTNSPN